MHEAVFSAFQQANRQSPILNLQRNCFFCATHDVREGIWEGQQASIIPSIPAPPKPIHPRSSQNQSTLSFLIAFTFEGDSAQIEASHPILPLLPLLWEFPSLLSACSFPLPSCFAEFVKIHYEEKGWEEGKGR